MILDALEIVPRSSSRMSSRSSAEEKKRDNEVYDIYDVLMSARKTLVIFSEMLMMMTHQKEVTSSNRVHTMSSPCATVAAFQSFSQVVLSATLGSLPFLVS